MFIKGLEKSEIILIPDFTLGSFRACGHTLNLTSDCHEYFMAFICLFLRNHISGLGSLAAELPPLFTLAKM